MGFFDKFKKNTEETHQASGGKNVTLTMNAKLQPMHRHELEDDLEAIFQKLNIGTITGGGTQLTDTKEIAFCDIEIQLEDSSGASIEPLLAGLNAFGIAKGSYLLVDDQKLPVGTLEGLGLYLNGTELPNETYQTCDINDVIDALGEAMNSNGSLCSHWEGDKETALYFYGASFETMNACIAEVVATSPLCQKARIVQIA